METTGDRDGRLVRALKALGDRKRFQMVRELAQAGELSCGQLGERFPLSQPAMSHHVKILIDAGILAARSQGQHHLVSVRREVVSELLALLPRRLAAPAAKGSLRPKAPRRPRAQGRRPRPT